MQIEQPTQSFETVDPGLAGTGAGAVAGRRLLHLAVVPAWLMAAPTGLESRILILE